MQKEIIINNIEKAKKLKLNSDKFELILNFSKEGYAYAKIKGNPNGCIIDIEGNILAEIKQPYDYVGIFNDGISSVHAEGEGYKVIDIYGRTVIEPGYEFISSFKNNKAVAKLNGLNGVINSKNEIIVPFKYNKLQFNLNDGIGKFTIINNEYEQISGYVDIEGNEIIFNSKKILNVEHSYIRSLLSEEPVEVRRVRDIKPGSKKLYSIRTSEIDGRTLFKLTEDNELIVYNVKGNILASDKNIFIINRNYFGTKTKGYCDIYGKMLIESSKIEYISNFINEFGVVGLDKKFTNSKTTRYTFVNNHGKVMTTKTYDFISPLTLTNISYNKGLAIISNSSKKGLISSNGDLLIPCKYSKILPIYHNVAACYDDNNNLTIEFFKNIA